MFENPNDILTTDEAMDMLLIGKNTIYNLLNSKKLNGFKIGRTWKIPRRSIDKFINDMTDRN